MIAPIALASLFVISVFLPRLSFASCIDPSEPFPAPALSHDDPRLQALFSNLETTISTTVADHQAPWNTTISSFAVELSSVEETVWRYYHTAPQIGNYTALSEPFQVDGEKAFRIASISKIFTTLAILLLEQGGKLSIRDPVAKYLPDLVERVNDEGIHWGNISLESLASQLSGVPREYGQDDLSDNIIRQYFGFENDTLAMGLPPLDRADIPTCGTNHETSKTCSREDVIAGMKGRSSVFPPNYKSSYSNIAFILLGFVIETVAAKSYHEALDELILQPLGMQRTTVKKPKDSDGVIPAIKNDWNYIAGAYDPTGGLYSTSSDLSKFLRAILKSQLLDEATTNAWLKPRSWSSSLRSTFGMPWEIFRSIDILQDTNRGVSLITKGGSLPGYYSHIVLVPEWELSFTLLVAGDAEALRWLENEIITSVLRGIEAISREQASFKYAGLYRTDKLNSSVELEVSGGSGLVIKSWVSNGTDFLAEYVFMKTRKRGAGQGRVQLVPSSHSGESWRATFVSTTTEPKIPIAGCLINDVDTLMYGGRSLEEFIFGFHDGKATEIKLPAFQITLYKVDQLIEKGGFRSRWNSMQQFLGLKHAVGGNEL